MTPPTPTDNQDRRQAHQQFFALLLIQVRSRPSCEKERGADLESATLSGTGICCSDPILLHRAMVLCMQTTGTDGPAVRGAEEARADDEDSRLITLRYPLIRC